MGDGRRPGGGFKRGGAMAGIGLIAVAALAAVQILSGESIDGLSEKLTGAPAPDSREAVSAQSQAVEPAGGERPFDYYLLSLSWSPSFCADRPDADQCGEGRRFIVHGLWPQFERGFPADCDSRHRAPSDRLLARYEHLTESAGLLAHQWRKHGTCTGLSPEGYFEAMAEAARVVRIPESLEAVSRDLDVDPRVLEKAFLDANPDLTRDAVTVKCRDNRLSEVRICLTADFAPRTCGKDVIRDCGARMIDVPAPR